MKNWQIGVLAAGVVVAISLFMAFSGPKENWIEIPRTGGIFYNKTSVNRDGNVVFVWLKNENEAAKTSIHAREIKFSSAFYCGKGKVRTLKSIILTTDGITQTLDDHHLEDNPGSGEINESHDLQDIKDFPELERAYNIFCR